MTKTAGNLSTRQKKLIEALITERKPAEAMEKSGISQSTYYRWRSDPLFVQALHNAEAVGMGEASRLANMRQGERTDIEHSANLPKVISQPAAAEMLNVSPRTVAAANLLHIP